MTWALYTAAGLSGFTLGIHLFLGGRGVARPLLAAGDLDPVAKYTSYFCWHIVTLVLAAMTVSFASTSRDLAILMTALAGGFTLWNLVLVVWKRQRLFDLPQWTLFLPIAVLGAIGLAQ